MTTQATDTNPLAMDDEDFLNQPFPGSEPVEVIQEVSNDKPSETNTEVNNAATEVKPAEVAVVDASNVASTQEASSKPEVNGGNVPTIAESKETKKDEATASDPLAKSADEAKDAQGKEKTDSTVETKPAAQTGPVDYEGFYKQVMAPFKANGKMIELRDPQEVIQLMQMGANYTRKMQDIQPHRKTLLMLENNQLLDPEKLSFLIDLNNGDTKAIQKLLKDKGVDPLSIDTSEDSNYLGGNHQVSDAEANFRTTLDELNSHQEGKATLQTINSTWDKSSKEVLWENPAIMQVMHEQREMGIYARIEAEVNRQRTLGAIPADLPFIQAYQVVGDALQKAGAFNDLAKPNVTESPASSGSSEVEKPAVKEPVATRVVTPKASVTNNDQASAAAATRSTPGEVKKLVNPLAMSDEEFLKTFHNRV
jgi:hypothetical protein